MNDVAAVFVPLAVLFTFLAFMPFESEPICRQFTVNYVIDGDTLVTKSGKTLRIDDINAVEKGSDGWREPKRLLKELTHTNPCYVPLKKGYYGRTIADVKVPVKEILLRLKTVKRYE